MRTEGASAPPSAPEAGWSSTWACRRRAPTPHERPALRRRRRGRLCPGGHRLGHRRRRLLALPAGVTTAQPPLPPAAAVHDGDGLLLRSLRIRRTPPAAAMVGACTALVRADGRGTARQPRALSPPHLARAPGCAVAAPELAGAHLRVGSAPRRGERLPGHGSRADARR